MRHRWGRTTGWAALAALVVGAGMPWTASAQAAPGSDATAEARRPVPGPLVPPRAWSAAVERGTRTADGRPGEGYWQNRARYRIEARLDPETARLEGRVRVVYENHAPAALDQVVLHLHQNLFSEGVMRNEATEITGGFELGAVRVAGRDAPVASGPGIDAPFYAVQGQLMAVALVEPLEPGDEVELDLEFATTLPQNGTGRMGWSEREMYFVAYWFPKVAVFDDLRGWDAEPFMGRAEFYDSFDDYEVDLTVPAGWTLMATGDLLNAGEVLSDRTLARLEAAALADTTIVIAMADEVARGLATRPDTDGDGWVTWRFRAENVRDFTFTTSNAQQWDATSARVADRDGDGRDDRVAIHTFWRPGRAPLWAEQARWAKLSLEFHSRYTGLPYPWPHMTSVEGADIIGGGMEFPMLTIIGPYTAPGQTANDLFNVTSHEIAHMWIPMIAGSNEKRHAWLDEGATTFLEDESRYEVWPGTDAHAIERENWLQVARAGLEEPLLRHGDWYETNLGYGVASYPKPATLLVTLRGLIGEAAFTRAYRAFIADWAWKLPSPWDLFAAFEREAGRDLDWFWRSFYDETWTVDHAIAEIVRGPDGSTEVVVRDLGFATVPVTVRIETTGAGVLEQTIPVETWFGGSTEVRIEVPAQAGEVRSVVVDPEGLLPDVDRGNNRWSLR